MSLSFNCNADCVTGNVNDYFPLHFRQMLTIDDLVIGPKRKFYDKNFFFSRMNELNLRNSYKNSESEYVLNKPYSGNIELIFKLSKQNPNKVQIWGLTCSELSNELFLFIKFVIVARYLWSP
jgi:hypothetical protein